jgi:hypothetical protein
MIKILKFRRNRADVWSSINHTGIPCKGARQHIIILHSIIVGRVNIAKCRGYIIIYIIIYRAMSSNYII